MRNVLYLVLLVPILALAAGTTETAVAPVPGMARGTPTPRIPMPGTAQAIVPARALVGTMDTVGGTIYDWVANGPTYRFVANSPALGVHVTWMYSNDTIPPQDDRNMRYNFYDYGTRAWNWIDPDYMVSGVNVFPQRAGFGNLDADPTNGAAIVSCHYFSNEPDISPMVARDAVPGQALWEYADGAPVLGVCQWPPIAVGQDGTIHIFPISAETASPAYELRYSRIAAGNWPTFDQPLVPILPSPGFPDHNIVASKVSNKVCLTWVNTAVAPESCYYSISSDGGTNWDPVTTLSFPPAYSASPDTGVTYWINSVSPFYDVQNRLHVIVNTLPIIGDSVWLYPSEIWHWCPDNTPEWSFLARADFDPRANPNPCGTNATMAGRAQLGEDSRGNLYAVWEQFDSTNTEPQTNLFRADIWMSGSNDNGVTWAPVTKIVEAGTNSLRFPSITDMAISGGDGADTLGILYQADQVAGFKAGSSPVGPWSNNAMIFQKVPADSIIPPGVAEGPSTPPKRFAVSASPSPASGRTVISYALPQSGDVSLIVYDAVGRPVQTLASGRHAAGHYSATWNAGNAAAGVYFYTLASGKTSVTRKLILTH